MANLTRNTRLAELEKAIEKSKDDLYESFFEIWRDKLYKADYGTFKDYCQTRWGFTARRGNQIVDFQKFKQIENANNCSHSENVINEAQHRALKEIPPEKRPEVLKKALESGKLTAESIKKAADDVLGNNTQNPISERPKTREEMLVDAWKDDKWSNVDATGYPIPPESQDIWDRRDEPKWMLKAISDVRCALEKINDEGDPLYRELNYSKLKIELDAIRYDLKTALPYAVCPTCQGRVLEDCDMCKERGFISKFRYDTVVPVELKALRDKVIQTKNL